MARRSPSKKMPDASTSPDRPSPLDDLPQELPVLPLRSEVVFPRIIQPLVVGRPKSLRLLDDLQKMPDSYVALVTQLDPEAEDPDADGLHLHLCVGQVLETLKMLDGSTRVVVQGLRRARLMELTSKKPYLSARVELLEDHFQSDVEADALMLTVRNQFDQLVEMSGNLPENLQVAALNASEPGALSDLLASGLSFSLIEKQQLLAEPDVSKRLKILNRLLSHQVQMQDLSSKIQGEASNELSQAQREQFLRQQMEAIRRELGEADDELSEINDFYDRVDSLELPESAAREARRELDRMAQMHPSSPEYHVIRTYIETILTMPWHESTEDRLDLDLAKQILDEDHYDLEKIKDRILEYLAVRKLKDNMRGPILCFVGPPGVGKTSLGKSIARTMNRKFIRISLGGMHDEAEIRGHRRTYIGAMPGRIIQGLRRLGVNNPVFMLDEIDKLGSDYRGDPASALLEVLDPEQNNTFRDHYLDVEFDLSKVMFICTANVLNTIPRPLQDRMEVLELSGYSEEEKLVIAHTYLIPKQLKDHGLPKRSANFTDEGVRELINSYTRESGLRNLEREIASVCRKVARQHATGSKRKIKIDDRKVHQLLGPPKYLREQESTEGVPGVATGLAWTPTGGELLTIECLKTVGKDSLKLTGSLGDVMKESGHAALGYLRGASKSLKISQEFFENFEFHIHVPAGAISKDGPSAGVALTSALLSLAREKPLRSGLAMTGEITLTGRVLAVGGVREKILAARREGLKVIILPRSNEKDLEELPPEVREDFTFIFVRHMDEVIPHLFDTVAVRVPRRRKRAKIVRYHPPTDNDSATPAPSR